MIRNRNRLTETAEELRRRAKKSLREGKTVIPESTSPTEAIKLFHELAVHQIELEMQNEELCRTQTALNGEQTRYFDLYNLAPNGYLTVNAENVIQEINLAAVSSLGLERGKLISQPLNRFIMQEDLDIFDMCQQRTFESITPRDCEIRMVRGDGTHFWATLLLSSVHNGECRVSFTDITIRKQAEKAFTTQGAFARCTLNGLRAHICVVDKQGTILTTNNSWNTFATENDAVEGTYGIGVNYLEACSFASGEDKTDVDIVAAGIKAVLGGTLPELIREYRCHSPDTKRWYSLRASRFSVNDEYYAVISHMNITEQILSKVKLTESIARFNELAELSCFVN